MTDRDNASVLAILVAALEDHGSWSGETHIQKCAYILQEGFGVPFDVDFVLYKHGPFSFDLRDRIESLISTGMIEVVPRMAPYGPSLVSNLSDSEFDEDGELRQTIDVVSSRYGTRTVAELERLATALYVMRDEPGKTDEEYANRIVQLKPHISPTLAEGAVSEMRRTISY